MTPPKLVRSYRWRSVGIMSRMCFEVVATVNSAPLAGGMTKDALVVEEPMCVRRVGASKLRGMI